MNNIKEAIIDDFGKDVYEGIWPMVSFIIAQLKSAINNGLDEFYIEAITKDYHVFGEYYEGKPTIIIKVGPAINDYDLGGIINERLHY